MKCTDYSGDIHVSKDRRVSVAVKDGDVNALRELFHAAEVGNEPRPHVGYTDLRFTGDVTRDSVRVILAVFAEVGRAAKKPADWNANNQGPYLDAEYHVAAYRAADNLLDVEKTTDGKTTLRVLEEYLRQQWKEWQGEDSLDEMAFGEPEEGGDRDSEDKS